MILESKHIGASPTHHLRLSRPVAERRRAHVAEIGPAARRHGQIVGRRKLTEVQSRVQHRLGNFIEAYQSGKLGPDELKVKATGMMREAWRDVFLAGLRAGGVPGQGSGPGKTLVDIGENDDRWLKSAIDEENRYLKRFMQAVIDGTTVMPIDRRIGLYGKTLESFYESSRIIAIPNTKLLHWVTSNDDRVCNGCQFLKEHSPFTKYTIPTAPRSSICRCATSCRCRLFITEATPYEVRQISESLGGAAGRDVMLRQLRALKLRSH